MITLSVAGEEVCASAIHPNLAKPTSRITRSCILHASPLERDRILARSYTTETAEETLQTIFQCDQDRGARSSRSCTAAGAAREPVRAAAAAERRVHLQPGIQMLPRPLRRCRCRCSLWPYWWCCTIAAVRGCQHSNPVSFRENRGRGRDSNLLLNPTSASAAAKSSAAADAAAAVQVERHDDSKSQVNYASIRAHPSPRRMSP
jgi:hypothetical protein